MTIRISHDREGDESYEKAALGCSRIITVQDLGRRVLRAALQYAGF